MRTTPRTNRADTALGSLIAYCVFEFGDFLSVGNEQWLLPLLQYLAILFYLCAYVTFAQDMPSSVEPNPSPLPLMPGYPDIRHSVGRSQFPRHTVEGAS